MLLGKYRGRHKEDDLVPLLHDLEGRAKRNLGLAVADIAADQAVHDLSLLEVLLHIGNRLQLVSGLRIGEEFFEFGLPHRVRAVAMSLLLEPRGVKGHQFLCDFTHGALHARLGSAPLRAAEAV